MKFIAPFALVALSRFTSALPCAAHSPSSTTSVATSTAVPSATSEASSATSAAAAATKAASPSAASSSGPVGYASQNGGTTNGQGGTTTTVTDVDALTQAITGDDAAIVYVSGMISG